MYRAALAKFNETLAMVGRGFAAIEPYKVSGSVILVLLAIWVIGMVGDALVHPRQQAAVAVASVGETDKPATKKKEEQALEPVGPLLASANVDNGVKVFKKCAACHTPAKGGKNKVGPNLWNIVNAKRGQVAGFSYSKNLSAKEGDWTYESLNEFLARPKKYIPGTKMAFAGLKKASDRANLIAYLRTLADSPAPLP